MSCLFENCGRVNKLYKEKLSWYIIFIIIFTKLEYLMVKYSKAYI